MNIEDLRSFCLSVPGTEECLPFDDVTLVYKVMGKMYALIPIEKEACSISVKCDPEKAIELRENFQAVQEARHFNKKYWNTLFPNMDMNDAQIKHWILHSIEEVIQKLPKVKQFEYQQNKLSR